MASVLLRVNNDLVCNRPVGQEGDLVSRHDGLDSRKLEKSVRQRRGGGDQKAAMSFSLALSRSSSRGIISEQTNFRRSTIVGRWLRSSRSYGPSKMSLNTRHACFRFEKIPVDIMSTVVERDDPMGEEEGHDAPVLPSRHRTGGGCVV